MSIVRPGRFVASVDKINLDELKRAGKRCILLDRDNTLVPRDTHRVPDAVRAWLDEARAKGFALYIVALLAAIKRAGCRRDEAVMVGDQLYTDVIAGNLAGVSSVLVKPQATTDLWYTQIFRIFERRALRGVTFEE